MLFKYMYLPEDEIDCINLDEEFFTLKFTDLSQYNDPYEQALAVDLSLVDSDNPDEFLYLMRTYRGEINKCKGYFASCFSKKPDVTPMWAHYANEQKGFVLALNEDMLREYFEESLKFAESDFYIEDIEYQSEIDPDFQRHFEAGNFRGKGIGLYIAQSRFFQAFYFHKQKCWEYEQERRVILKAQGIFEEKYFGYLEIPKSCVSYIIYGMNTSDIMKQKVGAIFKDVDEYSFKISHSNIVSYFLKDTNTYLYSDNNGELIEEYSTCSTCFEPIEHNAYGHCDSKCFWCCMKDIEY